MILYCKGLKNNNRDDLLKSAFCVASPQGENIAGSDGRFGRTLTPDEITARDVLAPLWTDFEYVPPSGHGGAQHGGSDAPGQSGGVVPETLQVALKDATASQGKDIERGLLQNARNLACRCQSWQAALHGKRFIHRAEQLS